MNYKILFFLLLQLSLFTPYSVLAGDSLNVEIVGQLPGGMQRIVDHDTTRNLTFTASNLSVTIFDTSIPQSPVKISSFTVPEVNFTDNIVINIFYSNSFLYVTAKSSGLRIIDISNPFNPFEVGSYDTQEEANDVYVSSNYAYVTYGFDDSFGLQIIDVSNKASPVRVGVYDKLNGRGTVYVSGDYAFIATKSYGLNIINISNPTSPFEAGFFETEGTASDVYVSGIYAYVAADLSGLRIIDVRDPTAPVEVGYYSERAKEVDISGSFAYVRGNRFYILDVSDPKFPLKLASISIWGAQDIFVFDNKAYVAISPGKQTGLLIIDVSNPSSPDEIGFYAMIGEAIDVFVSANHAYIADTNGALHVVDISDPTAPFKIGYCETLANKSVYIDSNFAYMSAYNNGLRIIDISNLTAPFETSFLRLEEYVWDVFVLGSYAYVAAGAYEDPGNAGLRIINVNDPISPYEVGFCTTPNSVFGVYLNGNYAYAAAGESGLRIIDVSDPTDPIEKGFYDTPCIATDVFVADRYAYVADDCSLQIIDVSIPETPVEIGWYGTFGRAYDVYIDGNYAYVAAQYAGIQIIDVSDPTNPFEVGFYDTPGGAWNIFVYQDYIYVADYMGGMSIYSFLYANVIYVNPDNSCHGETPCYPTIQEAIATADPYTTIQVLAGTYDEAINLNTPKKINLECGCNETYTTQDSISTIKSLIIENGEIIINNLIIGPST